MRRRRRRTERAVDDSKKVDQMMQRKKDVAVARKMLQQLPRFSERAEDWRWPSVAAKADSGNAE